MNYFDDYYSSEEPQEAPNYIPPQEPEKPKQRKERKGFKRLVSGLLMVALVAGSCSVTAAVMNRRWQKEMDNMLRRMDDKIAASQQSAQTVVSGEETLTGKPLSNGLMTPGEIYKKNVNAVVAVTAKLESMGSYGYSAGTGFIISADGYVVTNYHIIEDSTEVILTTHNDEEYKAKVIGYEADNDLALLKVDGENLPHVSIGSSSELQVGDQVVAIGNALSTFESTLTVGYVSGVDRVVNTEGTAMNMIQSDVAINSGNSGGPLFNMKGEVVGITAAKFSGKSSSGVSVEGISFAIPMDDVAGMIEDLKAYGYVTGAYMGVMVLDVDTTAQYYGLPAGAYVESVSAGGAAEKAGIHAQDIITEVGGYKVTSVSDLTRVLRKFTVGQTVTVEIYRAGQYKTLSITLDEKPQEETKPQTQQSAQTQPDVSNGGSFEDFYNFYKEFLG